MKLKSILILTTSSIFMCAYNNGGSSNTVKQANEINNTQNTEQAMSNTRFSSMTNMSQVLLQDTTTNLEWVNGTSQMGINSGCLPMTSGKTEDEALSLASEHCETLSFGSHTDRRVPTASEIQVFTVAMANEGSVPFYANPACPRIVGINEHDSTKIDTINTHNTPPIGTINSWTSLNAGVRCVRTFSSNSMMP